MRYQTPLITAACVATLALAGCGTVAATQPHAQPTPTVTKTVTASPAGTSCHARMVLADPYLTAAQVSALCEGVALPVVKVPVPGPTVTVNGDAAQLAQDTICIDALYQNIQGWKASGIVPNGWWDSRCPTP
jgi:hypothetical protein